MFTIAITGRPNVGKSTLFNRLTGKRHALVDDQPGVTRDWREGDGNIGPLRFKLIDTAGMEEGDASSLEGRIFTQTESGIDLADVVLLVIDARAGVTPQDKFFADLVRRKNKPVVLVLNKAEGGKGDDVIAEAYRLGLGAPIPVSAEHNEGMADLYDAIAPHAPEEDPEEQEKIEAVQIAIVGRPNVGKSTLLNALIGENRVLTGPEAGLTRDAIAVDYQWQGKNLRLVDTAGMRRRSNVTGKVEKLAIHDTLHSIKYAHVVVLVVDAEVPMEKQELTIGSLIEREGRAMIIAVNKWDKIKPEDRQAFFKWMEKKLSDSMPQMKDIPVVAISAEQHVNLDRLLDTVFTAYDTWNHRIGTGELNRWLEAALEKHPPPLVDGKRLKIRYMTQTKTRPPNFAMFVNHIEKLPDSYQRYLVNSMREAFNMPGVPMRINLRKGKNPYEGKE